MSAADRRAAFLEGVRSMVPLMVSLAAWGLVTGVAMAKVGLDVWLALAMSALVFAGSAQLTAVPLIAASAPIWLIFVACFIVNVRFVVFGAVLQPFFRHLPWTRRLLIGFVMTDASFVNFMAVNGKQTTPASQRQVWYMLGSGIALWVVWQLTSVVGVVAGAAIPTAWSLEFAGVLALLAMLLPMCNTRPALFAVAVASATAWLGQPLPLRLGLVIAVLAGVGAGYWAEQRAARLKAAEQEPRA